MSMKGSLLALAMMGSSMMYAQGHVSRSGGFIPDNLPADPHTFPDLTVDRKSLAKGVLVKEQLLEFFLQSHSRNLPSYRVKITTEISYSNNKTLLKNIRKFEAQVKNYFQHRDVKSLIGKPGVEITEA